METPVIIVGSGVFGLSAARHIRQRWPSRRLSIISSPSKLAPSDDISKIVRVDYPDPDRMKEAIAAQELWTSDSEFSPFYHPIGRLVTYGKEDHGTINDINLTRLRLGRDYRPIFESGVFENTFTTEPGTWSVLNLDDAMACYESGGAFYETRLQSLEHEGQLVTGITLVTGERLDTKNATVILAVGPWFLETLASSGMALPPPNRQPVATGILAFYLQLSARQAASFEGKPMFSHIGKAEFLPPLQDGIAKITWVEPYTIIKESGLSVVEDVSRSFFARKVMEEVADWARRCVPGLTGAQIINTPSYWDGVTETQVPLLARHPDLENLICAVGGSYTRAKDLPSIGCIIADVLGRHEVPDRFGWRPKMAPSHHDQPRLVAKNDFGDLEKQAREQAGGVYRDDMVII